MNTSSTIAIVLLAVVVLLLAAVVVAVTRKRRTSQLRSSFGPEYDRTVDDLGKRRHAEKELLSRKEEHEQLQLRALTPAAQQRFATAWVAIQSRFVDTPALALTEADILVTQLLAERGYPVDDFDTKQRLLSVEHSDVIDAYRHAHEVERASQARTADTESVRNAFLDFRSVFETVIAHAEPGGSGGSVSPEADSSGRLTALSDDPYPSNEASPATKQQRSRR